MKNMRKMMAVALSAAMVLALGACGGESTSSNSSTQSGSTSTDGKVYNIGIWNIRHWMLLRKDLRLH